VLIRILYVLFKCVKMRNTSYGEKKEKLNLTVTPTAKKWLKEQQKLLGATSLSDTLEKLSRLGQRD
jgi:hypothetical protein